MPRRIPNGRADSSLAVHRSEFRHLARTRRSPSADALVIAKAKINYGKTIERGPSRKKEKERFPFGGLCSFLCIELFCCFMSAVTYSPTTSRLQYHQRGQA